MATVQVLKKTRMMTSQNHHCCLHILRIVILAPRIDAQNSLEAPANQEKRERERESGFLGDFALSRRFARRTCEFFLLSLGLLLSLCCSTASWRRERYRCHFSIKSPNILWADKKVYYSGCGGFNTFLWNKEIQNLKGKKIENQVSYGLPKLKVIFLTFLNAPKKLPDVIRHNYSACVGCAKGTIKLKKGTQSRELCPPKVESHFFLPVRPKPRKLRHS